MDLSYTTIHFTKDEEQWLKKPVEEAMHHQLGVREEGYMFNPMYKRGLYDGIVDFYEAKEQIFPTGLVEEVEQILGGLQKKYTFQYVITENRPDPFIDPEELTEPTKLNFDGEMLPLREYQQDALMSIMTHKSGILNLPTNSGKTEIAAGIISTLLPKLERGETIAFFTVSSSIFTQTAERLEERLGIRVGKYGGGKKDIRQVNVVMVPTIAAGMKTDPEKGLKLTAKERITKKMAKKIAPKFVDGVNQRQMLKAYLMNFQTKTKADQELKDEIQKVLDKSESDAKLKFHLNGYVAKYNKLIQKKNKKAYEKRRDVEEFLDSIVAFISDEHQHVTSDSLYNTLLACQNAIYRVGLTGSIDPKNKMLHRRLKAVTGEITAKESNEYMIDEGHSAKPKIMFSQIRQVQHEHQLIDISGDNNYMSVYEKGIVKNDFRNLLIAKITEMCYNSDKGVLIIVSRIEHGENIASLLEALEVPHEFLRGEIDLDYRDARLDEMRSGELKVMIATSILDEGVDVSGIDALIMAAGGKSFRQTLQRVGRALRKKKGKENVTQVYDFADRTNRFLYKHYKARESIYKDENFDITYLE